MSIKQRWTWLASALALAVGFTLLTAAYGVSATKKQEKRFATFRSVYDAIDYMDPAQAYTGQAWSLMYHVYETLVTYPHLPGKAGGRIVPDLAQSMPKISKNGRTYSFVLRKGLRYSNGKPVQASDFKYSLKRLFITNSQGVGFYTNIVGAEKFSKTLKGDISGVVTNNAKRTVTYKLVTPRGDFLSILALLFASPVPTGTANKDLSSNNMPSTGPYHVTGYVQGTGGTLTQNKYFKPSKWVPRPNPTKITFKITSDAAAALDQVTRGQADYTPYAIPSDRLGALESAHGKYLRFYASANTYYFWMNVRSPVFKKLKARQAIEYAIDRNFMKKSIYAGVGHVTQNILPPNYPQYKALHLYKYNLAKARTLIQQAGVKGAHVTVWGRNVPDMRKASEYLASVLPKIGLVVDQVKILPSSTYYTTIGNAATTNRDIGWARWLEDYPHPSDWFDVLINGHRITAQNNNNYANANSSKINAMIERLNKVPLSNSVNAQWAQVDKLSMQQAFWAPYVNRVFSDYFNSKVNMSCYVNQPIYHFDFARICPK